MTDPDDWERVGRETLHRALSCLLEDAGATVEPIADAVYWDHDVSPDQVEAMRQLAFDFEYATEAYLARLCDDAEPWNDDADRTPSRLPAVESSRTEGTGVEREGGREMGDEEAGDERDEDEETGDEREEEADGEREEDEEAGGEREEDEA